MSQNDCILNFMQMGGVITPAIAYESYGCLRLSERIRELQEQGFNIDHVPLHLPNGKRVMSYKLAQEQQMTLE